MAAIVDICPNCGSPLQQEADGTCHFCHAPIRVAPAASSISFSAPPQAGPQLRPATRGLLMPMEEVLTVLLGLSREPGMAPFCAHPGVQVAMQQLVDRIYDAGARIAQLDNPADREGLLNTKVVTPEELWLMNLCADAGKEIATAKGTDPFQVGFARDTVDILHRHFGTHTIKKANKETAPPTPELENLRALVPQAKL